MRAVIGWSSVVTLLAVSVLGVVSAPRRGAAIWMVIGVTVAAGLGGTMLAESVPRRDGWRLLLSTLRPMVSVAAGVAALLGTMAIECHDVAGVPSWERCETWLGTPTVDWGAPLLALVFALGVGYLVWWLLGKVLPNRVEDRSGTAMED